MSSEFRRRYPEQASFFVGQSSGFYLLSQILFLIVERVATDATDHEQLHHLIDANSWLTSCYGLLHLRAAPRAQSDLI